MTEISTNSMRAADESGGLADWLPPVVNEYDTRIRIPLTLCPVEWLIKAFQIASRQYNGNDGGNVIDA